MRNTRGPAEGSSRRVRRARTTRASVAAGAGLAGWTGFLDPPGPERARTRALARVGGLVAVTAVVVYLTWRIADTLPPSGWNRTAAWILVGFEAIPLVGLFVRLVTLWNLDSRVPPPATTPRRVAVMIPTYNEPVEVIAPTIAAACQLEPAHETWVLDDGDRDWVAELCRTYGARYVRRPVHDHAKAGNMNHALDLMAREAEAGAPEIDVIAVLDCDHVPLPHFLTATLGWFEDPEVALVQGPQEFYNAGAFDDDGVTGEQGLFFHVLMAARNHDGAGPFWCGSTSLLRTRALQEVGGVATDTIVEDMHTTLQLIKQGWKTVYHHQTLAVGLAPATAEQYLLQRRRWGMGAMQVLSRERLWAARRWLSWRNYYEYLSGTLWWLEGVGTVAVFAVPTAILLSGAQTSTAGAGTFAAVFAAMFALRVWGLRRLFRHHLQLGPAFALRVFRIPVGLSCGWWLLTRRTLAFEVTPKAGSEQRTRGRVPGVLRVLTALAVVVLGYAAAGVAGLVPWRSTAGATLTSAAWLLIAAGALALGMRRIVSPAYATSRRNAYRVGIRAAVEIEGIEGELVDISTGGAAVRFPRSLTVGPADEVKLTLPDAPPVLLHVVRAAPADDSQVVSLRVPPGDWAGHRALSLWLFHTPAGAVRGLPAGVPAAAVTRPRRAHG
ncbi:glycosyltransferase [Pimelobacter simplex]|uniref:glycosyltransferase n=1 Tax=Nocardioides simplex TaxID=2045 RepID=UPI001931A191|nr:glycosyltransferase [Pimelobacter simplex]